MEFIAEIIVGWFDEIKSPKLKQRKRMGTSNAPDGMWKKCTHCGEILQGHKLEENLNVCPYCDQHYRLSGRERLAMLVDDDSFIPEGEGLVSRDPLGFVDKTPYKDKLELARQKTGRSEGTFCGIGKINGRDIAIAVMDFSFMGGSMGAVAGEKIAHAMDLAFERHIPCIVISCSGGARMQEGIVSLMQMAKTSASRERLRKVGVPYISILTDPTTGGCAASFAMQGDLNLAEPKALIGFAGPRVIEQSIRQSLPEGFQTSEFLLSHGFIDAIVHRRDLKKELSFYFNVLLPV